MQVVADPRPWRDCEVEMASAAWRASSEKLRANGELRMHERKRNRTRYNAPSTRDDYAWGYTRGLIDGKMGCEWVEGWKININRLLIGLLPDVHPNL